MKMSAKQRLISKVLLFLVLLIPCLWLVFAAVNNQLGADPAKKLVDETGLLAIQCLWLSLAMTPLKNWTGSSQWIQYRRMIGLFAFFSSRSESFISLFGFFHSFSVLFFSYYMFS